MVDSKGDGRARAVRSSEGVRANQTHGLGAHYAIGSGGQAGRAAGSGQSEAGSGQWIVVGFVLGDVVTGGDTPQSRRAMSRQQAAADT
jgi:hypothetical protein